MDRLAVLASQDNLAVLYRSVCREHRESVNPARMDLRNISNVASLQLLFAFETQHPNECGIRIQQFSLGVLKRSLREGFRKVQQNGPRIGALK